MPSFDVVSNVDLHEVDNAWQQASREIEQRYDFKGSDTTIERNDKEIVIRSDAEGRIGAALDVLRQKLAKRGVSLQSLEVGKIDKAGKVIKQFIKIQEGIDKDKAKNIVKFIKDNKYKVQAAIQGDQLRISGKKRDDLQAVISALKEQDFGVALQYVNFRD